MSLKAFDPVLPQSHVDPRPTSKMGGFLLFCLVFLFVGRAHEALGGPIRFNLLFTAATLLFCVKDFLSNPLMYFKESTVLRRITYFTLWAIAMIPFSRWPGGSVETAIGFLKVYTFVLLTAVLLTRYRLTAVGVFAHVVSLLVVLFFSAITESASVRVYTITKSYDPNEMALIAVMILPILFFAIKNAKFIWKAAFTGGVAVCVVAIALSGSRGGMLGLFMVGAYVLFVSSISMLKKVLIVIMSVLVFIVAVPQENLTRLVNTLDIENDYNVSGKQGRLVVWAADLEKIIKNPIAGVGLGQSTTLTEEEMDEGVWMEAHNSYIEMALETGIPGFCFLFSVMLISWRRLRELRRTLDKKDPRLPLVHGLEAGLWGYFVCITFLSVAFYALSLFFFVMIEAVYRDIKGQHLRPVAGEESAQPEPEPEQKKKKRRYKLKQGSSYDPRT
ncbi:MAG: hypothetical protein CL942_06835 [Desulfovibrio sp.]|nr:hypothetical protein [Desulfovibrio sp.]